MRAGTLLQVARRLKRPTWPSTLGTGGQGVKPADPAGTPTGGEAIMDNREKREFEAGLAADVDAWLKGEPTRRTFITKLGQMTGHASRLRTSTGVDQSMGASAGGGGIGRRFVATRQGPSRRTEGLDRGASGRIGFQSRRRGKKVQGRHPQYDVRIRPAGA